MKSPPIVTIIATSRGRTEHFLPRALSSVIGQSYPPQLCIVVDDNADSGEYDKITNLLRRMRTGSTVELISIPNVHTRGHSGTGAWNCGLEFAREYCRVKQLDDAYIAILDDDDYWQPDHLEKCVQNMQYLPDAVFCNLTRVTKTYEIPGKLKTSNDLTVLKFLFGNPGVQGSNMCFKLSVLEAIGGFDELLMSCSDRDLMIRFLDKFGNQNISVVKQQTVRHNACSHECVTNDVVNKTAGLDTFYQKHLWRYDYETLQHSLARAERSFAYPHSRQIWEYFYQSEEIIAVMMPLHNGANSIRQSVLSFVKQENTQHPIVLFIGNDASSDTWQEEISDLLDKYPNIIVKDIDGGNASKARNALTEYVLTTFPLTYFLCRLDADDELYTSNTLSEVEHLFMSQPVQAVLGGNFQAQNNRLIWENRASKSFYDPNYMLARLLSMAHGDRKAELPSCNLCFRPEVYIPYPPEYSGEDHWLLVTQLLLLPQTSLLIAEELMYCIYNLDGNTTQRNKDNSIYLDSRLRLYEYYRHQTNL